MRFKPPKVNFIFYEYVLKVVVGNGNWKQCFAENKRLGTNVSEAFAHAIIENNYFAWLYDYKNKNPGCTLQTKYNLAEQQNEDSNDDNNEKWIFCSDFDKIEIALPKDDSGDYELAFKEGTTKTQAQAAAEELRKNALENVFNQHHMQSNKKVKLMLMTFILTTTMPNTTSQVAAKAFTKKKTRKDSEKFKGWLEEGKAFMVKMMKAIKDDVESGTHGKWEKVYKEICIAINKSDQIDQGGSSSDDETDYSVLYAKV
jgi:hypothetical protein